MVDKHEYEVELVVTRTHLIQTFSRTPEEAIADAEVLLEDGEDGQVLSVDIEAAEAFPVGEEPLEMDDEEGILNDE